MRVQSRRKQKTTFVDAALNGRYIGRSIETRRFLFLVTIHQDGELQGSWFH